MSGKNENWNEIFGDDFSAEDFYLEDADALDVSSLDEVGESAETFPIDAAFFASDEDYQLIRPLGDTSVIPPEVQDLTAYTDGNRSTEDWPEDDFEIDFGDSLDDLDEDEEDETDEERAIQLTRRKRTGLMGGLMYAAFIVGISLILASVAWMIADDVLALTKEEFTVEIVVPENFTIEDVAEELYAQGVIRWRPIFIQFARIYNAEDRIEPGLYQVSPVDYRAIINRLNQRTGQLIETTVLIPEGRNMREIFEILEENGVATAEALEEVVNTVRFDEFEWLAGLPMTTMNRLEGYLFPDTYTFFRHQNPETVIRRMLRNFDFRMRDNDIFELLEESDLTLHEAVNIAAMIEKEIANWDEAPIISSVIHNRLNVP
ncbi:MAG: endolytic transglycosylase MltG, partial [Oscillospiraceae bacterium]|nr:endolytic transglycosylase MltG [Oscillospiraceae bacterium]